LRELEKSRGREAIAGTVSLIVGTGQIELFDIGREALQRAGGWLEVMVSEAWQAGEGGASVFTIKRDVEIFKSTILAVLSGERLTLPADDHWPARLARHRQLEEIAYFFPCVAEAGEAATEHRATLFGNQLPVALVESARRATLPMEDAAVEYGDFLVAVMRRLRFLGHEVDVGGEQFVPLELISKARHAETLTAEAEERWVRDDWRRGSRQVKQEQQQHNNQRDEVRPLSVSDLVGDVDGTQFGKLVAVLAPAGHGKSSLLRYMACEDAGSGNIVVWLRAEFLVEVALGGDGCLDPAKLCAAAMRSLEALPGGLLPERRDELPRAMDCLFRRLTAAPAAVILLVDAFDEVPEATARPVPFLKGECEL
jgi:hypothetical protein